MKKKISVHEKNFKTIARSLGLIPTIFEFARINRGADRSEPQELCILRVSVVYKKTQGRCLIHLQSNRL